MRQQGVDSLGVLTGYALLMHSYTFSSTQLHISTLAMKHERSLTPEQAASSSKPVSPKKGKTPRGWDAERATTLLEAVIDEGLKKGDMDAVAAKVGNTPERG